MKNFIEKEYHPVIENYITDYVDDTLETGERDAFEEVLVHDDDLRELAFSAKEGKRLIQQLGFVKADQKFKRNMLSRIKELS
jgi:anti-sigma factor RsiW